MSPTQLAALLQLSSPSLPIGGYSYSQGMESAVELGLVIDEPSAQRWIESQLELVVSHCEAPVWSCFYAAFKQGDDNQVRYLNEWFLASRESQQLLQETQQMGWSLLQLSETLQWCSDHTLDLLKSFDAASLPCVHAGSTFALNIGHDSGLTAYLFAWLENQVMAAMKTVPLGQVSGQRLVQQLGQRLETVCACARSLAARNPPALRTFAPQFAVVASRHESQYSRLFRS